MINKEQAKQMEFAEGFVAALDQSGGSTPKALAHYGVEKHQFSNDEEMFDLMHNMRSRIMRSPNFTSKKIIGAILFENTMEREVAGKATADYLWTERHVVPFLKVDKGLADVIDGTQMLKPIPELNKLLQRAKKRNIFGTKMRSVVHKPSEVGIEAVVRQQFEIGKKIIAYGLVPIIEPEVNIHAEKKAKAENILVSCLKRHLDLLDSGNKVILKLTLPESANHYEELTRHPNIMRVVALSGGYSRNVANKMLSENKNIIASFSRALTEGLSAKQTDGEFNAILGQSIDAISSASSAG